MCYRTVLCINPAFIYINLYKSKSLEILSDSMEVKCRTYILLNNLKKYSKITIFMQIKSVKQVINQYTTTLVGTYKLKLCYIKLTSRIVLKFLGY